MNPQALRGSALDAASYDVVVIGAGQAGLSAGYFLARTGLSFIILDNNPRAGGSWPSRWDSLRLFTPAQLDGLPGFPFPAPQNYFPTKNEVAAYLSQYEQRFSLPVRYSSEVQRLSRVDGGFRIDLASTSLKARQVIVATGPYRLPKIPALAAELDPAIFQLHSSAYCNPEQLQGRNVLVVGAANSGSEIALELARAGKQVWLAGREVGMLPSTRPPAQLFGGIPAWWLMNRILTVDTPIGRRMRTRFLHFGHPLGRVRRADLAEAGVRSVARIAGAVSGQPGPQDAPPIAVESLIWATGYRPDYHWIELPIFDELGYPLSTKGVVESVPGIYFLGNPFQRTFSSSLLGRVGADAAYVVRQLRTRSAAA